MRALRGPSTWKLPHAEAEAARKASKATVRPRIRVMARTVAYVPAARREASPRQPVRPPVVDAPRPGGGLFLPLEPPPSSVRPRRLLGFPTGAPSAAILAACPAS